MWIIWVVQVDSALYVVGSRSSGWVQRIADGANVEMRLSGNTYALTAVPIKQELERVVIAYKNKYRSDYPDIVAVFPTLEEADNSAYFVWIPVRFERCLLAHRFDVAQTAASYVVRSERRGLKGVPTRTDQCQHWTLVPCHRIPPHRLRCKAAPER